MRPTLPLLTAVMLLPLPALADAQLDRLEDISEASNALMTNMMLQEVSAGNAETRATLEAVLPDMDWTDPMRDAGACMIEAYEAELGSDGVDAMLDEMEVFIEAAQGASIDEMAEMEPAMPDGMTPARSLEITQDCGMLDLQMQMMSESGFMDAMMEAAMAANN